MIKAEQKKIERDLLLEFKRLYSEFPRGEIKDSEAPDFLVVTNEGVIGIEIARYFRGQKMGQGSGGSPIRQVETNEEEFLRVAQNIYEAKQLEPLIVDFHWYGNKRIGHKDVNLLAEKAIQLIEVALPLKTSTYVSVEHEQLEATPLEEYLSSILLSRPAGLKSSRWLNNGKSFWELREDELQSLITSKEGKLDQYLQKCGMVWLLIVATGERTSSTVDFPDGKFTRVFKTKFSKVFLYDRGRQKIGILSKQKWLSG